MLYVLYCAAYIEKICNYTEVCIPTGFLYESNQAIHTCVYQPPILEKLKPYSDISKLQTLLQINLEHSGKKSWLFRIVNKNL